MGQGAIYAKEGISCSLTCFIRHLLLGSRGRRWFGNQTKI